MSRHLLFAVAIILSVTGVSPGQTPATADPDSVVIEVRSSDGFPPYEYLDDQGVPTGFNIDIIRAVATVLDLDITIDLGPWAEVRHQLESGEIDALAGMFQTAARDSKVDFCSPHLVVSYAVFVRKGSPISSITDIENATAIVMDGDLAHDYLIENDLAAKLVLLDDSRDILRSLADGCGDCAIIPRLQGMSLIQEMPIEGLEPVGKPIIQRKYGFAVSEGNTELLAALNEGMSIIKATGEYGRIHDKWFGAFEDQRPALAVAIRHFTWFVTPLAAIALILLAWTRSLRRQVELRTNERLQVEHEKMELERQLAQAQKMEAIGTLAGGIAHDFNNILGAIMGYVDLARDSLPADSPANEDLDEVTIAAKRAAGLIKQILVFSRQQAETRKPVDIDAITVETLKLLRATIPTTVEFCTDIAAPGAMVVADPAQIHQVIMNLCTNAYHAMQDQGGVLDVRLHHDETGENIRLEVSDTGVGMDPEVARRCMEPFFTTKETGRGTGMGLSVVYGIVTDLGGQLAIESQPGRGTTVTVTLPCDTGETPVESPQPAPPHHGSERILFVDDEPMLADLAARVLKRLGYEVRTFTDSLEALEAVRTDPDSFDVLITDQTMPGLTGGELVQEVRSIRPDVPVILCTGYSDVLDEAQAEELGVGAYLMKPVAPPALADALARVLGCA